jgi:hypothetical protein
MADVRVTGWLLAPGASEFRPIERPRVQVGLDGSFDFGQFGELLPGAYRFTVDVAGGTAGLAWSVRSATVGGQDVLDAPLTLTELSQPTVLLMTLSSVHASLAGTLLTPASLPAVDYLIVAFPTNRRWWAPPFRRVRTTRPATDGYYSFDDLPSGEYFLLALTTAAPDEIRDPRFLEQMATVAIRVQVVENERRIQDLRIAGL